MKRSSVNFNSSDASSTPTTRRRPPPALRRSTSSAVTNINDIIAVDRESEEYQYWLLKVQENGCNLEYAPEYIRGDKQIVVAAVNNDGWALKFALRSNTPNNNNNNLQDDKEIVLIAVQNDGLALKWASPKLQNDKEVVMAAIQQSYGSALEYTAPELQNNKEVVLAALNLNPDTIKYAHNDIKHDPDVLTASGMYDEHHMDIKQRKKCKLKKIALSTRFSLNRSSYSEATNFTKLLKENEYIRNNFIVFAPNAYEKQTCDPNWTNFNHPCRGTTDTCQMKDKSLRMGRATNQSCWRYSFRNQLQEAKDTGGFMLQLIEKENIMSSSLPTLGNGQEIELDMAKIYLEMKIFQIYRPIVPTLTYGVEYHFEKHHIDKIATTIKNWYDDECRDMSVCVIRQVVGE